MHEELAAYLLGVEWDEVEDNIYNMVRDELNIEYDVFENLIDQLLPLIMIAPSALSKCTYKGFADIENSQWLIKIKTDEEVNNG